MNRAECPIPCVAGISAGKMCGTIRSVLRMVPLWHSADGAQNLQDSVIEIGIGNEAGEAFDFLSGVADGVA